MESHRPYRLAKYDIFDPGYEISESSLESVLNQIFTFYYANWARLNINDVKEQLERLYKQIMALYVNKQPPATVFYIRVILPFQLFKIILEIGYLEPNNFFRLDIEVFTDKPLIRYGYYKPIPTNKEILIILYILLNSN